MEKDNIANTSNVKIIDFKRKSKKRKGNSESQGPLPDTESLDNAVAEEMLRFLFINEATMLAQGYVSDIANGAGLGGLEFRLQNGNAETVMAQCDAVKGVMPPLTFLADGGDFEYIIHLAQKKEGCEMDTGDAMDALEYNIENIEEVLDYYGGLFRLDKGKYKKYEEPYEFFNYDSHTWETRTTLQLFGLTRRQMEMASDPGQKVEHELLCAYRNAYDRIDDGQFEQVMESNQELLALAKSLSAGCQEHVWFSFDGGQDAALVPSDEYPGAVIEYAGGMYRVRQDATTEGPGREVFATEDAGAMAGWIEKVFGKKMPSGTKAIVPLSEYAWLVVDRKKECVETVKPGPEELDEGETEMADAAMRDLFGEGCGINWAEK